MSEHELDKLFSKKLKTRPLDYNPKAWAAMEAMLEAKTRSYAFYWRSAAAIFLMAGLLSIAALNHSNSSEVPNAAEQTSSNNSTTNNNVQELDQPTSTAAELSEEQPEEELTERAVEKTTNQSVAQGKLVDPENIAAASTSGKETFEETTPDTELNSNQRMASAEYLAENKEPVTVKELAILNMSMVSPSTELEFGELVLHQTKPSKKSVDWGQPYVSAALLTSSVDFSVNQGAGFSVGIGYQKQLGAAFQVGAEINYVYRATPSLTTKHDSVFYSFSQERVTNITQVKSLSQLQIPVYLNYTLANKHRLGAGLYGSILLNADVVNSREQRSSSQLLHKTSAPVEQEENWVNPYGMGWLAQYAYILSPSVELGFRFNQSFTDVNNAKEGNQFLFDGRVFILYGF